MVTTDRPPGWDPSTPAPGPLEVVRGLVNTLDRYRGRDRLVDVDEAHSVLADLGLLAEGESCVAAELEQVRSFRAAVRFTFVAEDPPPDTRPGPSLHVVFRGLGRIDVESVGGLQGRLAELSVDLLVAHRTGRLTRLRACANPACRWLFWDGSRPGTGRWCSMQVCGAQHKARTYRARQRRQP